MSVTFPGLSVVTASAHAHRAIATAIAFCRVQLIGRPYAEATLLRAAAALEQHVPTIVPPFTVASALPLQHAVKGAESVDVSTPRDQQLDAPLKANVRLQAAANGQHKLEHKERRLSTLVRLVQRRSGAAAGAFADQRLAVKRVIHPL
jgi:hypothetical protein